MFGQLFGKYLAKKGILTEEEYRELVRYSSDHNRTITETLKKGLELLKEQERA